MPDWKGERPDKIQGFRLKSFKDVHEALATVLNECIREGDVPGRLVEGRTSLVMKDSKKGTKVARYRPIDCLNLIRKLLTGISSDKIYDHLEERRLLPEQQNRRSTCNRCVLQNCTKRKTNLSMAWVVYKVYNMVLHWWIIATTRMVGVAGNITSLIEQGMHKWKINLYADGNLLGLGQEYFKVIHSHH